jgi:hypothetical protein
MEKALGSHVMSDKPNQQVKAESGGIAQVAGGDQDDVTATTGGRASGRALWAKTLAVLFGAAALVLLVLGIAGVVDWQVVAVPLIIAFLLAAGAAIGAVRS